MIAPRFLRSLALAAALFAVLAVGFIAIVNPYNASPVDVRIGRLNDVKPRSRDVDRLVKPFQVWLRQPKTVFLGTSRIHQSIDPRVLDGGALAPAYNASIPASSLGMNIAHLKQYFKLDKKLEHVFIELFAYNFLGQGQEHTEKSFREFIANDASLLISSDALWDSAATVIYNLIDGKPTYEVKPDGYFYYPPGHNPEGTFAGFPGGIWHMFEQGGRKFELSAAALESVHTLATLARERGMEPVFIATPDHVYFDYYVDVLGKWDVLEAWLKAVSAEGTVYSFAQSNAWTREEPGSRMIYWNDPFHFSLKMGEAMQLAILGRPPADAPADFMVRLTPDKVPEIIARRRAAVREWAAFHGDFVDDMREMMERVLGEDAARLVPPRPPLGRLSGPSLLIDRAEYPIVGGYGGSLERVDADDRGGVTLDGWAADTRTPGGAAAKGVAVVVDDIVTRVVRPNMPRADIAAGLGAGITSAGFHIALVPPRRSEKPRITLFALTADGHAVPISNGLSAETVTLSRMPFPGVADRVND